MRGHWGIAVLHGKNAINIGTLFRSIYCFSGNYGVVVGKPYKRQKSDTVNSPAQFPVFELDNEQQFWDFVPKNTKVIGVENTSGSLHKHDLINYCHVPNALYVLGNEVNGIPIEFLRKCNDIVYIPGRFSLNVAVAGSILMYDRILKQHQNKIPEGITGFRRVIGKDEVIDIPMVG